MAAELNVVWPAPGRYVVAVSGGADSMVLLDLLAGAAAVRGYELAVAHVDHGLRPESAADAAFVRAAAGRYGLAYAEHAAALGRASEAQARAVRHAWLQEVRARRQALAVVTAHHQDDLLETSLLNLARGTGRLGLAPMAAGAGIVRPLLGCSRAQLRAYAASHAVTWREDPTNADTANPRNYLRHELLPAASPEWRAAYLEKIATLTALNKKIIQSISFILGPARQDDRTYVFDRPALQALTAAERQEVILAAARELRPGVELSRTLITEIAAFAASGHPGSYRPLRQSLVLELKNRYIILTTNADS